MSRAEGAVTLRPLLIPHYCWVVSFDERGTFYHMGSSPLCRLLETVGKEMETVREIQNKPNITSILNDFLPR